MPGLYENEAEAAKGITEAALSIEADLRTLAFRISDGTPVEGVSAYVIGIPREHNGVKGVTPIAWAYDETVAQTIAEAIGGAYHEAPETDTPRNSAILSSSPEEYDATIRGAKGGE